MVLKRSRLITSSIAIEKYKNRKVRIYCVYRNAWIKGESFTTSKNDAEVFVLTDALEKTKHYQSEVEFNFIDNFGEKGYSIKDFTGIEDFYIPNFLYDR